MRAMSKWQIAADTATELYQTGCINHTGYRAIRDGLDEIETLAERDAKLESLWAEFGDVPMDPKTECMEAPFLDFPVGDAPGGHLALVRRTAQQGRGLSAVRTAEPARGMSEVLCRRGQQL